MKKLLFILLLLFLLLSMLSIGAEGKTFSLQECLAIALKNNIALGIKVVQVERQEGLLDQAREKFLPALAFQFNKAKTNSPSYSWIEAEETISAESQQISGQLVQALWLGGSFSLSVDASRYDSNQRFQTINPRYEGTVMFKLVQPLLRDMGDRLSRKNIIIASHNRNISVNELKTALLETVYRVEELYWNLVFAERNLEVKKKSLQLAENLMTKNRKMVELGLLAEIEILTAETEVASRQADILAAQALLLNTSDELLSLMNEKNEFIIRTTDEPRTDVLAIDVDESLSLALTNRPDLLNAGINLRSKDLEMTYARNQLLPALNLNMQYWSPGISGNRLRYRDDNPLTGDVIAIIPGASGDALEEALNLKYRNWAVYLSLDVPLNSIFYHGAYTAARMDLREATLRRLDLERQIRLEVLSVIRDINSAFQRIQAYRTTREFAEKRTAAEEKRLAAGMSTSYIVLQYQRDYAQALGNELQALCEYNQALARLERVRGTGLEARQISFAAEAMVSSR